MLCNRAQKGSILSVYLFHKNLISIYALKDYCMLGMQQYASTPYCVLLCSILQYTAVLQYFD